MSIRGKAQDFGISEAETILTSANLTKFAAGTDNGNVLWGFNTADIYCDPALEVNGFSCTNNESVYVILDAAFDGSFTNSFNVDGMAITTIPVPGAVWLLGSALGLLGWLRRRKI